METFEQVVLYICAGVLSASLLLTMFRMAIGPNSIDRVMSLDTISATAQCGVALYIAWTLDTTPIPMVLVLALITALEPPAPTPACRTATWYRPDSAPSSVDRLPVRPPPTPCRTR